MGAASQLSRPMPPAGTDWRVRGTIKTPLAVVELHEYSFHGVQNADFAPTRSFLDLALSHRPGHAQGHYTTVHGHARRTIGDLLFVPAGLALRSQWGGGMQRSVCLEFESARSPDEGWTLPELDATLDIRSPLIRQSLLRLADELEHPGFESRLMVESICTQLGIDLGRYLRGRREPAPAPAGLLSRPQLDRIEARLRASGPGPGVAELATACGMSERHFFRMFRATTGVTPFDYAANIRIAKARDLLRGQKRTIKEIAWACGFQNAAAFSHAFRRATGYQPREYRQIDAA